jgi:hypothetical protein
VALILTMTTNEKICDKCEKKEKALIYQKEITEIAIAI